MDFIYDLGFIKGRTIPTTIPYEGARIMDYLFTNTARAVDLDAMWRCGHHKASFSGTSHVPAPGLVATTTTRAHRAFMS